MFRLIGLIGWAGSGLPRVVSTCNELGIWIPEIDKEMNPAGATVHIGLNITPHVPKGNTGVRSFWNTPHHHGDDSIKATSQALGLSTSTLSRRISTLREWGRIERIGSKRSGKWIVK